ncbi:MAG: DUF1799 domain-containing protein [Pseudomonadota bacterium]
MRALMGSRTAADDSQAIEDAMALMAISRDEATEWVRGQADAPADGSVVLEVAQALRPAVRLFCAMISQWRMSIVAVEGPAGPIFATRRTGFDLSALDVVAGWIGVSPDRQIFEDLRVMEAEALAIEAER